MQWADKLREQFLSCGASPGVRRNRYERRPWCVFRSHPWDIPQFPHNSHQAPPKFPPSLPPKPEFGPKLRQRQPKGVLHGGVLKAGFVVWGRLKASWRALGEHGRIRRESCRRGHKHTGFSPIGAYRETLGVPGKPSGKPDPLFFGGGAWGACAPSITGTHMYIYVKVRSTHLATLVTFEMTTRPGHRQSPRMSAREWGIKKGPWAPQKDSRGFSRGALGGPNP